MMWAKVLYQNLSDGKYYAIKVLRKISCYLILTTHDPMLSSPLNSTLEDENLLEISHFSALGSTAAGNSIGRAVVLTSVSITSHFPATLSSVSFNICILFEFCGSRWE